MEQIPTTSPATIKLLGNKLYLSITAVVIVALVLLAGFYLATDKQSQRSDQPSTAITGTGLNLTSPELISDESSVVLLGTVLSHETANIYPRREGIVEDVYVDIGDTVKKGQIVALLLPKGVEGQSAAIIAEQQARKAQAESNLKTAEIVAEETIIGSQQKISELQTDLEIAKHAQEAMLADFAQKEAQILQTREQAYTTVRSARQLIEQTLLGSNSRPGQQLQEDDLLDQLGLLSPLLRYDILPQFNDMYELEQQYLSLSNRQQEEKIYDLIAQTETTFSTLLSLLGATPTVPSTQSGKFTQTELASITSQVLSSQNALLKAKEMLQDAETSFDSMTAAEPDVYRAYRTGNSDLAKSSNVKKFESQIVTAYNSLELTKANQEQMIERQRTQLSIAESQLNREYAQTGHRQIRSPFSGVVSKRFVEVGQIVMPSMASFELTGVPTTLAKKAKAEIRFGLPEELRDAVEIDDSITFFLPADELESFEAVITRKSPQVDMQTRTFIVHARVPDELKLPHQTSVRVRITDSSRPLYRVSSLLVKREDDRNFLWVLDPESNKPEKQYVSVSAEDGEFADITGDISEETSILLDPPDLFPSSAES